MLGTYREPPAVVVETAKERVGKGRPGEETAAMVTMDDKANDPTASSPKMLPSNDAITPEENKLLGQITGWGNDWLPEWQKTPTNSGRGFSGLGTGFPVKEPAVGLDYYCSGCLDGGPILV